MHRWAFIQPSAGKKREIYMQSVCQRPATWDSGALSQLNRNIQGSWSSCLSKKFSFFFFMMLCINSPYPQQSAFPSPHFLEGKFLEKGLHLFTGFSDSLWSYPPKQQAWKVLTKKARRLFPGDILSEILMFCSPKGGIFICCFLYNQLVTASASTTRIVGSKDVLGAQGSVVFYFISLWFNFNLFSLILSLMEIWRQLLRLNKSKYHYQ